MGTTRDKLTAAGTTGVRVCYVVAIEGLDRLLTDHSTPSAVELAWAATEWETAISGLKIHGGMQQKLEPWESLLDVTRLKMSVLDEDLARLIMASRAGEATVLDADLDVGDATVTVKSTTNFETPSGDPVLAYCGIECFSYSGKTATTLTSVGRGRFSPFKANTAPANRFSRQHTLADISDVWGVKTQPLVTSAPRHWHGKWVGIWMHAIDPDGTIDTKAEAEKIWAGRISDIAAPGLEVVIDCEDVRGALRDCVLGSDQFTGRAADGMYFESGWQVIVSDNQTGSGATSETFEIGTDLAAGVYTVDEFMNELSAWMLSQSFNADWSISRATVGGGSRVVISAHFTNTAGDTAVAAVRMDAPIWHFLGFEMQVLSGQPEKSLGTALYANFEASFQAELAPFRAIAFQSGGGLGQGLSLHLSESRGTWFNNSEWLPGTIAATVQAEDPNASWGIVQVGRFMGVGYYTSDTQIDGFFWLPEVTRMVGGATETPLHGTIGIREDEEGDLDVRQIISISGSLKDLVLRFFASTDGNAYNHTDYDDFSYGFGAAIPWELLGDDFEESVDALVGADGAIVVNIEQPTSLWDALGIEFTLRNAHLAWKDGALRFTSWNLGNSELALHTFTESNKAGDVDTEDDLRSTDEIHRDWLANVVKVEFNRDAVSGEFRDEIAVRDAGSIADYGESKAETLEARNTYGAYVATGDTLYQVVSDYVANVLPLFSRPVRVIRRTIDYSLFLGLAPGDVGTLTDDDVRDPDTGVMGVTGLPVLVIGVEWDWGGDEGDGARPPSGTVDLVLNTTQGARTALYSPAAVVTSTSGADFTLDDDGFSEAAEDDDANHFANAGEKVYFLVPADGTVEQHTIASRAGNVVTMEDVAVGAAGYLISRSYADAVATQRTDAYQADEADGLIEDLAQPFEWMGQLGGGNSFSLWTAADYPRELGYFTPQLYGDGAPVSTLLHDELARAVNNFVQHRSCQMPVSLSQGEQTPGGAGWTLMELRPHFIGPGIMSVGRVRTIDVAPLARSSTGSDARVRVTFSTLPPTGFDSVDGAVFSGAYSQATFTFSSTTLETAAKQNVQLHVNANQGFGYITVEAEEDVRYYGLAMAHTSGPQ